MQAEKDNLIPANEFCTSHQIAISFIQTLGSFGLLEITTIEETMYLPASELPQAERMARLYGELGINIEGIDAIKHLLLRIEEMQHEISSLKNRLSLYE